MYFIKRAIISMVGGDKKIIKNCLVENLEDERVRLMTEHETDKVSFVYEDLSSTWDEENDTKEVSFSPRKAGY